MITFKLLCKILNAYINCSEKIQCSINEMIKICLDETSTEDEKHLAFGTIVFALELYLDKKEIDILYNL